MKGSTLKIGLVIGVIALAGVLAVTTAKSYNKLQAADESVHAGWAYVVNQYQRRSDLVPNLVRVVRAYADHERELFKEIAEARAAALAIKPDAALLNDPGRLNDFNARQEAVRTALSKMIVIAERYPELRSNEAFLDLQAQLEGTENRISHARDKYVYSVGAYNILVRSFPTNMLAQRLGYQTRPTLILEAGDNQDTAPEVML